MNNSETTKQNKRSAKLWCVAFTALITAILLLPSILMLLGVKAQNKEKRPLAREPELVVRGEANLEFPQDFDDYLQDHFALREEMVSGLNSLTIGLLSDTLNTKTIVGKNMLFFSETLRDYQRAQTMSDYDIARAAAILRIQQDAVKAQGKRFIFAVAPNKSTIYPENMPSRYYVAENESDRERLYSALSALGVDTVDLAGLLLSHKQDGILYHAEDTHWNERGALLAYRALMAAVASDYDYDDYLTATHTEKYDYEGDLHNFVLPAVDGAGAYPHYDIEEAFAYDEGTRINQDTTFATSGRENGLRLTVFRDSFTIALLPYISTNAERAVYSTQFPYNYTVTEADDADAVIIELVERNIKNLVLAAPVMAAAQIEADENALTELKFTSTTEQSASGLWRIAGAFELDDFNPATQKIIVRIETDDGKMSYYEAFPVGEKYGFELYVENAGEARVYVW